MEQEGATVLVRKGEMRDLEVLVRYNIQMAKETEGIDLPEDVITRGVKAVLEGKSSAVYYVVEEQASQSQASTSSPGSAEAGKVVAQLMVTLEWSDWRANWVWWIQSVYCHPAARKQGHFKRLYAHVRAEAQAQGAAGLRLYADDGNTSAHAAYSKLGMSSHYKVFEDMFTGD